MFAQLGTNPPTRLTWAEFKGIIIPIKLVNTIPLHKLHKTRVLWPFWGVLYLWVRVKHPQANQWKLVYGHNMSCPDHRCVGRTWSLWKVASQFFLAHDFSHKGNLYKMQPCFGLFWDWWFIWYIYIYVLPKYWFTVYHIKVNKEPKTEIVMISFPLMQGLGMPQCLDLLKMLGKSKTYSPKWWFNGNLM